MPRGWTVIENVESDVSEMQSTCGAVRKCDLGAKRASVYNRKIKRYLRIVSDKVTCNL